MLLFPVLLLLLPFARACVCRRFHAPPIAAASVPVSRAAIH